MDFGEKSYFGKKQRVSNVIIIAEISVFVKKFKGRSCGYRIQLNKLPPKKKRFR